MGGKDTGRVQGVDGGGVSPEGKARMKASLER